MALFSMRVIGRFLCPERGHGYLASCTIPLYAGAGRCQLTFVN
jgi:hypothetical protein